MFVVYVLNLQAKEVRRLADRMVQLGKEVCASQQILLAVYFNV
jgi:hypothetical protein